MEGVQELKHVCKFCSKSFPCGRSLGGHMRSHMSTNNNNNSADQTDEKLMMTKKRLLSDMGNDCNNTVTAMEAGINGGYVLREKPKKKWRLSDFSEDGSIHDKLCKECGKGFLSWKALFGHMKCHSTEKERVSINNSLEEQDSCQSDNETAAPSKGRRSKRRTRYMGNTTFSLTNNHASSSMSEIEIEQEQEEVALSLMMLSRDVGHWGGFNSVAESSDNSSVLFLEAAKVEVKAKQKQKSKNEVFMDESVKCENSEVVFSKNKLNSSKRKSKDSYHPEPKSGSVNKLTTTTTDHVLDSEFCKEPHKRIRFECTTCNKIFHSYQALGGHRASHRKTKGCFASRINCTENSVETSDNKVVKSNGTETPTAIADSVADSESDKAAEISYGVNKNKGHECPICFKVFPSGQALGGHKRSHLAAEAKENRPIVAQKPVPEIRDFLDLNLPAPVEEETIHHVEFKPWWVGTSHKHEPLVGLISN